MTHPTTGLDDTVHQRFRLGILAILSHGDKIEFGYLRTALGLSAGNLSRHLTTLVEAGFIKVTKGYHNLRPRTWIAMTKAGLRAYRAEIAVLQSLLALADVKLTDLDVTEAAPTDGEPPVSDSAVIANDAHDASATDTDDDRPTAETNAR